jgi:hypothetical protein
MPLLDIGAKWIHSWVPQLLKAGNDKGLGQEKLAGFTNLMSGVK